MLDRERFFADGHYGAYLARLREVKVDYYLPTPMPLSGTKSNLPWDAS